MQEKKVMVHLKAAGWETYAGPLCGAQFKDGVSVEPIQLRLAFRIGATIQCEDDVGVPIHPSTYDRGYKPGQVEAKIINFETDGAKPAPVYEAQTTVEEAKEIDLEPTRTVDAFGQVKIAYSRAQLEAIADKRGINGLREIGESLDVKGRAVAELIDKILEAQA